MLKLSTDLSIDVPENEKDRATKIIANLDYLQKLLKSSNEYLDLIYTPFKDNSQISPEQSFKARDALRRFRDKVAEYFNTFKKQAFKCIVMLQPFSFDTQIIKISKSFILCIGDIEKQVNRFIDLFSNLEAKDFGTTVVQAIENIKKEVAQLDQIIEDRLKNHIQNNILARNWIDNVSDELETKVEKRVPQSIQMVEERQKELEKVNNN